MQSSEVPAEAENTANAKVYISNINKNIDQQTLRKKFQQFGQIRSFILKKKPNDVTYSFIEYQTSTSAALAISKLNGTEVWERILKVQYGLGGKKGFPHYLTDAQRDKRFGESRYRRDDSADSYDRYRKYRRGHQRDYERRRDRSRDSRRSDEYSPGRQRKIKQQRRRRDYRQRRRDSYSSERSDSYYRGRRYRDLRQRGEYRQAYRRESYRQSPQRRKSIEKQRKNSRSYHESYQRRPRYNSPQRSRQNERKRYHQKPYQVQKRYSPQRKNSRFSKESSEQRRNKYRDQQKIQSPKNKFDRSERVMIQKYPTKGQQNRKKQRYQPIPRRQFDKKQSFKQQERYRRPKSPERTIENAQKKVYAKQTKEFSYQRRNQNQPFGESQRSQKYRLRE